MTDSTSYIDDIIPKVTRLLTSPECALLFNDLYDNKFIITNQELNNTPEAIVFGPTLFREEEDVLHYTSATIILDEFIKFDIYRITGLNLVNYMDLTRYERAVLNGRVIEHMDKMNSEADRVNRVNKELLGEFNG